LERPLVMKIGLLIPSVSTVAEQAALSLAGS
jgi:hypothetical protein